MRRCLHVLALLVIGCSLMCWIPAGISSLGSASGADPTYELVDDYYPGNIVAPGSLIYAVDPILYQRANPTGSTAGATDEKATGNLSYGSEVDGTAINVFGTGYGVWDLGEAFDSVVLFPRIDHQELVHMFHYEVWGANDFDLADPAATNWMIARLDTMYIKGWSDVGERQFDVCSDDYVSVWKWPTPTGGADSFRYVKVNGITWTSTTPVADCEVDAVKGVLSDQPDQLDCGGWQTGVVEEGRTFRYTSLEYDSDNRTHVAYGAEQLFYAMRYSGDSTWHVQEIDKGGVGAYCSLALDGSGRPAISYYDATNGDLKYAYQNGTLNAVWGSSSSDVYAVGDNGTILHYGGATWNPMASPTTQSLRGIWGSSWNNVFAVGDGGAIIRGNGSSWSVMAVPGGTPSLYGVWGSAPDNVFAVGAGGTILRFNGATWGTMATGTWPTLHGIWGNSPSNVLAVGDGGTILRFDGGAWTAMSSGTSYRLSGVWGSSSASVFAVGDYGTIRRFNGTSWSSMTGSFTDCLSGVWGSSASDVFAVGCRGAVLRYNGSSWSAMIGSTTGALSGVWGSSSSNVLAVGYEGLIIGYDGTIWTSINNADGWVTETVDRPGNVGQHTSLAFYAGRPAISYYDATNGDLKYAGWTGTGWDIKTVDGGADRPQVGEYSSLAFDSLGRPAVSYYDATNEDLRFARWDDMERCWVISGVMSVVDVEGDVGRYSSLAFDGTGNPAISYHDATLGDLKYAHWNGAAWSRERVDSQGWVGQYSSLAFDTSYRPGISYFDAVNQDLKYTHWNGIDWDAVAADTAGYVGGYTSLDFDGSGNPSISYYEATNDAVKVGDWSTAGWNRERVDAYPWVGRFSSLAFDARNNAAISFYDPREGDLKYALWQEDHWAIEKVDSYGDVGRFTSLVFDGAGNPAISYYEVSRGNLKYAAWDGTAWIVSTLDSVNDVGSYSSLALDSLGNPAISYYDATNGDLKFCRWNGQAWVTSLVDEAGDVGMFASLDFDASDNPGISYYDAANGYLKCAVWNGSAWVIGIVDTVGDVGSYCSMHFDCVDGWAISYYDATNGDLKYAHGSGAKWEVQVVDSEGQVGLYTSLEFDSSKQPAMGYHDASQGMLKLARWDGQKWNLETIDDTQAAGHWTSLAFNHCGSLGFSYDSPITGDLKYASLWNPPPSQPVNRSPRHGATCVTLTPTLESGAFADNCTDSHWASRWVIATDNCVTNCNFVFDSGVDRSNLLQIEIPQDVLQPNTVYYWSVTHQDCGGAWSEYSAMTGFTTSSPPQQPVNVSPADGAADVSMTPSLESSGFIGADAGDNHVGSQWQITGNQGDYMAPLFDQTTQSTNLTQITVPAGKLSNRTTYYWRVRYQGSCGNWSEFSVETSFFVDRNPPEVPANQTPTDGAVVADVTPALQASAFVDPDAGDSHQASQWRVTKTPGDYSTPVFDSGADRSRLTQVTVPGGTLEYGTSYYWQVRYQDSLGSWSDWSVETGFSTGAAPPVPAGLVVAAAALAVVLAGAMTAAMVVPL